MELLTLLAGWVRTRLAGGVHLAPPAGIRGGVTILERVQPIPRLRALVEPFGGRRGPLERFATLEGEPAGLLSVATPAGERTLALVVGDDAAALIDGLAADAQSGAPVRRLVRELAETFHLGLGEVRRRRYHHDPPRGWAGLGSAHAARWLHPQAPRVEHVVTVFHARPRALTAPALADRILFCDDTRGLRKDPPARLVPVTNRHGLGGMVARISGRQGEGGEHLSTVRATLADDRFLYEVELAGRTATLDASLGTFLAVVESIEPIARPRTVDLEGRVLNWGD